MSPWNDFFHLGHLAWMPTIQKSSLLTYLKNYDWSIFYKIKWHLPWIQARGRFSSPWFGTAEPDEPRKKLLMSKFSFINVDDSLQTAAVICGLDVCMIVKMYERKTQTCLERYFFFFFFFTEGYMHREVKQTKHSKNREIFHQWKRVSDLVIILLT